MRTTRLGFSLIETMFALLLVALLLGVVGDLLGSYSRVSSFSSAKAVTLTNFQVALQQMLDDVRQATLVESPSGGSAASDLRFQKIDPTIEWISGPGPWDPLATNSLVEVRYYLSSSLLLRAVTPLSGTTPTSTWQVADSVAGLQTSFGIDQSVVIQMSLQETTRLLVITGISSRPAF